MKTRNHILYTIEIIRYKPAVGILPVNVNFGADNDTTVRLALFNLPANLRYHR